MNRLIRNTISVQGKDNALKVAATLMENDYQVFIQLDDCDIYVVSYAHNQLDWGCDRFALVTAEEEELIEATRADAENIAATNRVRDLLEDGYLTPEDLDLHK